MYTTSPLLVKLKIQVPDRDALDVLVLLQAIQTALLSIPALLNPSKRCLGRADLAGVHTHHAHLQLLSHAHDAADVAREEVSGEAELGIVGEPYGILFR